MNENVKENENEKKNENDNKKAWKQEGEEQKRK